MLQSRDFDHIGDTIYLANNFKLFEKNDYRIIVRDIVFVGSDFNVIRKEKFYS